MGATRRTVQERFRFHRHRVTSILATCSSKGASWFRGSPLEVTLIFHRTEALANDEARMMNDEARITKAAPRNATLFGTLSFGFLSSFVIGPSSFGVGVAIY